jgi:hypothetical protein
VVPESSDEADPHALHHTRLSQKHHLRDAIEPCRRSGVAFSSAFMNHLTRAHHPAGLAALIVMSIVSLASGQSLSPLWSLPSPHPGKAMHEGSWDRKGGNADARAVAPGQTITLLDHQGPGVIRRFWVTIAPRAEMHIHRQAILRMYWDDSKTPAVECPIGDFFGVGFGEQKDYTSLPLNEMSGGYNCYWPMPFHKSARWTLENRSDKRIDAFYYNIDYTAFDDSSPAPQGFDQQKLFHAYWHRENPTTPDKNYTVLDVKGDGHVVGVALFMQARKPRGLGFLEGDEMVYIDGREDPSSPHKTDFVGTGTEDFFSSGWYFDHGPYSAPYHGCVIKDETLDRISAYRWYVEDAVPFNKSIRFTIEHGTNNNTEADYSSVCYFYASGEVTPPPPLPANPADLLPYIPPEPKHFPGAIEAESLHSTAKTTGGKATVQSMDMWPGQWSGGRQIFWIDTKPGDSLTLSVPVKHAGEYQIIAHFTRAPDYGIITARINNGPESSPIDLYADKVEPSGAIPLGRAKLRPGKNTITLKITGKNDRSKNTLIGIDALELKP